MDTLCATAPIDLPAYAAEDGTLYWTLSFYIPYARIGLSNSFARAQDIAPLRSPFEAAGVLAGLDADPTAATRKVRDAVDPLFNDIADRTRQGKVPDRLLVDGQRQTVIFHLPEHLGWKTEGRRFRVAIPESDQQRPAEARRFWYLHSNGAMSWHVAFAVRYRDALDNELAAGRVSSLYFLSLLQKLAWPKECDPSDVDSLSTDALLDVRVGMPGAAIGARKPFWKQLEQWFAIDRDLLENVHPDAIGMTFADLLPTETCIEVPGLETCETRSLFFIQDKQFFDLIQPKTPSGVLVPRRQRVLDEVFERYPQEIRAIKPGADQIHRLDEDFWLELLRDETPAIATASTAPDGDKVIEDASMPPLSPAERLLSLFLAGFNQNIIDWANQEASEVLDSLDPIYPSSDEQLEEGFFIRYANPQSLITYVSRSRTLEVGNDHILTCPYAFLIHILAMNNEHLTRAKELRTFEVIDWVSRNLKGCDAQKSEATKPLLTKVEQHINRLRIDSFEHFDRHRYVNPFRYDTERDVFDKLENLRGTSRLEIAHKEALAALEEHTKDLDRLRAEDERTGERLADNRDQDRDRRLAALFGLIGLSGLGQLLFNIRDFFTNKMKDHEAFSIGDFFLVGAEAVIACFIAAGIWRFVLSPWLGKTIEADNDKERY